MIIAIDGYASTGKSVLSKRLSTKLNYFYLDTGYMYRVITYLGLKKNLLEKDTIHQTELNQLLDNGKFSWQTSDYQSKLLYNGKLYQNEIRSIEVSEWVSKIANIEKVRDVLIAQQRELAYQKNIILDGRDIGTVVFPDAEVKFFLTANLEVRAERRTKELIEKGKKVTYDQVYSNISFRDTLDINRKKSPLQKAHDAIEIDTSNLNLDEVNNILIQKIKLFLKN